MATIVNTPASTDQGTNTGVLMGLVLAALVLFAVLFFGARNWTGLGGGGSTLPQSQEGSSGQSNTFAPEVDVPKDVNVNVDTPAE